jgi:hypothetical protein
MKKMERHFKAAAASEWKRFFTDEQEAKIIYLKTKNEMKEKKV